MLVGICAPRMAGLEARKPDGRRRRRSYGARAANARRGVLSGIAELDGLVQNRRRKRKIFLATQRIRSVATAPDSLGGRSASVIGHTRVSVYAAKITILERLPPIVIVTRQQICAKT